MAKIIELAPYLKGKQEISYVDVMKSMPDYEDRTKRIRDSLAKINRLFAELKEMANVKENKPK